MSHENLILSSVVASVDFENTIMRGHAGKKKVSECDRVVSFLETLASATNATVAIGGLRRSLVCTVEPSSGESVTTGQRRVGCAGRIALLGSDNDSRLGADVKFNVRAGRVGEQGTLTLTFNPSRLLAGADVYPSLIDAKPTRYPSSQFGVTHKLVELPFELLDAIHGTVQGQGRCGKDSDP